MPMSEVAEYAGLANVLEAQERMNAITDSQAAAAGVFKMSSYRRHMRDLERQGRGRRHRGGTDASTAPQTLEEMAAKFATVGVSVVKAGSGA